ncbi:TetR/AcrR family transcriptional regulator [Methanobacterium sp. ACI-7]|uniref:TetR/AcrR family transcriptional regulator n=1 Tax=unclassified Methanobacterium TaxID=2627676 RepID=UPI0039C1DB6D
MSFKKLKEQEKEQRREYIVETAEKLFLEKGYNNVSMNDISQEIGVNRATLYLYFKNKDSLYFTVLLRGLNLMMDFFQKSIREDQNGLERLVALCSAFFSYYNEHPEYYHELCYMRARSFDISQIESVDEQMIVAQELMDAISNSIKMGVSDGSMKKDLDPMKTAVFVVNNCEKIVNPGSDMIGLLGIHNITPEQYMEYSFNLLISTISEGLNGCE